MRSVCTVVLSAATFALAGCDSGSEADEPPSTTAAQTTTAATTTVVINVDEPAPSRRQIVGTWTQIGMALLWRFDRQGGFVFDRGNLDQPFASGTYELDGSTLLLEAAGPGCTDTWRWRVGIDARGGRRDDELHVVFLNAGCDVPAGADWRFARLP